MTYNLNLWIRETEKKISCKRCKKETTEFAVTNHPKVIYTICWDCLIDLDVGGKDWKKYKKTT